MQCDKPTDKRKHGATKECCHSAGVQLCSFKGWLCMCLCAQLCVCACVARLRLAAGYVTWSVAIRRLNWSGANVILQRLTRQSCDVVSDAFVVVALLLGSSFFFGNFSFYFLCCCGMLQFLLSLMRACALYGKSCKCN